MFVARPEWARKNEAIGVVARAEVAAQQLAGGKQKPAVALFFWGRNPVAVIRAEDARALADKLHDAADEAERNH